MHIRSFIPCHPVLFVLAGFNTRTLPSPSGRCQSPARTTISSSSVRFPSTVSSSSSNVFRPVNTENWCPHDLTWNPSVAALCLIADAFPLVPFFFASRSSGAESSHHHQSLCLMVIFRWQRFCPRAIFRALVRQEESSSQNCWVNKCSEVTTVNPPRANFLASAAEGPRSGLCHSTRA